MQNEGNTLHRASRNLPSNTNNATDATHTKHTKDGINIEASKFSSLASQILLQIILTLSVPLLVT